MNNQNKLYKIYPEFLRLIACFLVIANHTVMYTIIPNTPGKLWYGSWVYFFISKIAVPVFLMISGALLLGKQDTYKKTFGRVVRVLIALVVFSFVYYLNGVLKGEAGFSILEFVRTVYHGPITNAYWYMYLYMALLICMPFLQKMVKSMQEKDYRVFFLVSFVILGTIPILSHYWGSFTPAEDFKLYVFATYIGYLMAGYYIDRFFDITKIKVIVCSILFVAMDVFLVVLTKSEYNRDQGQYFFYDDITLLPIIFLSVSVFIIFKYLFEIIPVAKDKAYSEKTSKIIRELGACTFGAYLIADLFLEKLVFVKDALWDISQLVSIIVLQIVVYIASMLVAFVLRRIPFVKKVL